MEVKLTHEQEACIAALAARTGRSVNDVVVDALATWAEATNLLLDRKTISADVKSFEQILDWMNRPPTKAESEGMRRLLDTNVPW